MLFVKVCERNTETDFLINIEQITTIDVDGCNVWLADSDAYLTLDATSMDKVLNILKTVGAMIDN